MGFTCNPQIDRVLRRRPQLGDDLSFRRKAFCNGRHGVAAVPQTTPIFTPTTGSVAPPPPHFLAKPEALTMSMRPEGLHTLLAKRANQRAQFVRGPISTRLNSWGALKETPPNRPQGSRLCCWPEIGFTSARYWLESGLEPSFGIMHGGGGASSTCDKSLQAQTNL